MRIVIPVVVFIVIILIDESHADVELVDGSDVCFRGYGDAGDAAELKTKVTAEMNAAPEGIGALGFGGEGGYGVLSAHLLCGDEGDGDQEQGFQEGSLHIYYSIGKRVVAILGYKTSLVHIYIRWCKDSIKKLNL